MIKKPGLVNAFRFSLDSVDNWGQTVCNGTFELGPVHTYNNANTKFRKIYWNDCSQISPAFYDEGGLYWGEWGAFKKKHGFWGSLFQIIMILVGFVVVVYIYSYFQKMASNSNNTVSRAEE